MNIINQIEIQLKKMTESEKDMWILSQSKLLSESEQEGILVSLSGEKKTIHMPTLQEIDEFCEKINNGDIYFEYETHYCEFDDDGRYMDDWKVWHNDLFGAVPFLNRIFTACHDLLCLEEYQIVADIMKKVSELKFRLEEAADSEDSPEEDFFSLPSADKENLFSRHLADVGADWIKAVAQMTAGQDSKERAKKLFELFRHPICCKVKPRILMENEISQDVFADMIELLEKDITKLNVKKKQFPEHQFLRDKIKLQSKIDRDTEMLLDIHVKCLKTTCNDAQKEESGLAAKWEQIQQNVKWLSYEKCIDDQLEIDEIQDICEELIHSEELKQEKWEQRKTILEDIVRAKYYNWCSCGDIMLNLAEKLCTNKEEYLAWADMMEKSYDYEEKAANLYYKYGREDKYVAYLENHLDKRSKEYSALITYYQAHDQQDLARRVAKLGLERCKEDLTEFFLCLLADAKKAGDQEEFKKLYASAKRRKHVDFQRIKQNYL